mmetsp:Transcript_66462/g.167524  ORF Transcript_66462/g.167524 Transcript_66462/m.167524 type:complete len:236 (-) Transcript_66462:868-1575(-)
MKLTIDWASSSSSSSSSSSASPSPPSLWTLPAAVDSVGRSISPSSARWNVTRRPLLPRRVSVSPSMAKAPPHTNGSPASPMKIETVSLSPSTTRFPSMTMQQSQVAAFFTSSLLMIHSPSNSLPSYFAPSCVCALLGLYLLLLCAAAGLGRGAGLPGSLGGLAHAEQRKPCSPHSSVVLTAASSLRSYVCELVEVMAQTPTEHGTVSLNHDFPGIRTLRCAMVDSEMVKLSSVPT